PRPTPCLPLNLYTNRTPSDRQVFENIEKEPAVRFTRFLVLTAAEFLTRRDRSSRAVTALSKTVTCGVESPASRREVKRTIGGRSRYERRPDWHSRSCWLSNGAHITYPFGPHRMTTSIAPQESIAHQDTRTEPHVCADAHGPRAATPATARPPKKRGLIWLVL